MSIFIRALAFASLTLCLSVCSAAEYRVSPRDEATMINQLKPGDTLRLTAGRHQRPLVLRGIRGTAERPIRVIADAGAVLEGVRPITTEWTRGEDGIWTAQLDHDIWQLFVGDRLVYLARWPDANFEDGSLWRMTQAMRSADGGYNHRTQQFTGRCRKGVIYDAPFKSHKGDPGFHEGDSRYEVDPTQQSLTDSGKDFTGAVAVLNVGHWLTWARRITAHTPGQDHFAYAVGKEQANLHPFFAWYVLGLAALDRPNEWWFDAATRTVHYMPPPGVDPNTLKLRGRVRDFGVTLKDCAHLSFENVDTFAAGFFVERSNHIHFESCRFLYPATHKFGLGEFEWFNPWNAHKSANKMPSVYQGADNRFINCEFAYCNAPIYLGGDNILIENCLFHDIEWDVNSSGGSGSVMIGRGAVFRRNTIFRTGNSEGVRPVSTNARVELNRLFDLGNLQHDGAAVNVGTRNHYGSLVANNWAYDCNRQGLRFDYHGERLLRDDGQIHGDGVFRHNVTWNTQPNQVKGDRHLVLNNTVVSVSRYPDPATEAMTMSVQGFHAMHDIDGNRDSLIRNNLANLSHRSWNLRGVKPPGAYELPGVSDHNMREPGAALRYLRDPANYDFRPREDSLLVDGGATVTREEVKSPVAQFEPLAFVGSAPDIGAYEHGVRRYWIPGRQESVASTPIPKDGGVNVPLDFDLMFLEAYGRTHHRVYFGSSPNDLGLLVDLPDDSTNIITPPDTRPNQTYYWRVDAVDSAGNARSSPVWSFTTGT